MSDNELPFTLEEYGQAAEQHHRQTGSSWRQVTIEQPKHMFRRDKALTPTYQRTITRAIEFYRPEKWQRLSI